ncbi:Na-translocating system protein MpsC family protein [Cohnella caldifontis]|uniref:Na-translocating system protein MpsC family protein n=1 Tax=Cohnella caldifontis TaxID=3027471 RepID=UPI0023EBB92D|nr:Na-translocating system protein MpsC family protein [Cohnella sp. YIM B05605]
MDQEKSNAISGYVSKLLRQNFGRGPQICQTFAGGKHMLVHIRGFISPMEEVLMREGSDFQVEKARTAIIDRILGELEGIIRVSLEREVKEYYQDWNFPNNSGVLMFELDESIGESPHAAFDTRLLEQEIVRISRLVQRAPDEIHTYVVSPRHYLVERNGILIAIEKALIKKGFAFELKSTKDELEKTYLHRQGRFDQICGAGVSDIFVDWSFKNDKSLMAFILGN